MSFSIKPTFTAIFLSSVIVTLFVGCAKDDLIEEQNKQIAEQSALVEEQTETIRSHGVKIEVYEEQSASQGEHLTKLLKLVADKSDELNVLKEEAVVNDELITDQTKRLLKSEDQLQAHIDTSLGKIVVRLFEDKTPLTVANFVDLVTGAKPEPKEGEAAKPFYDGLIFHRIIKDFMIQGGCPQGNGLGDPGYKFEDECYAKGEPIVGEITETAMAVTVFEKLIIPHLQKHDGKSPVEFISTLYAEMEKARSYSPLIGKTVEEVAAGVGLVGGLFEPTLIEEVRYGTLCMANSGPNTNGSQFFIVSKKDGCSWLNGKHTVFGEIVEGFDVLDAMQSVETDAGDRPTTPVVIKSVDIARVVRCVEFMEKAPTPLPSDERAETVPAEEESSENSDSEESASTDASE